MDTQEVKYLSPSKELHELYNQCRSGQPLFLCEKFESLIKRLEEDEETMRWMIGMLVKHLRNLCPYCGREMDDGE